MTVTEMVIQDLKKRADVGLTKYGTALLPFNGRDPLQDLYEELLDAAQYIKQAMVERDKAICEKKKSCECIQ